MQSDTTHCGPNIWLILTRHKGRGLSDVTSLLASEYRTGSTTSAFVFERLKIVCRIPPLINTHTLYGSPADSSAPVLIQTRRHLITQQEFTYITPLTAVVDYRKDYTTASSTQGCMTTFLLLNGNVQLHFVSFLNIRCPLHSC